MKTLLAAAFVATLCLAGCASGGASGGSGAGATGGSGITVFGTIDAGVSNVRNQSK